MPTTNIYYYTDKQLSSIKTIISDLKQYLAKELSVREISLNSEEISIRCLKSSSNSMIGEIEIDISAHAFSSRIENQDKICLSIRSFIMAKLPEIKDVRVWLKLSELGHSWE